MRRALPLLLLVAACEPRRDPRNIERALSAKVIDDDKLEDLLSVEPGALRIHAPEIPATSTAPPGDGWHLENVGRRPVWLRRKNLRVAVTFEPFVPPDRPGGSYGGGRRVAWTPLSFVREEWILLERAARIRLPVSAPVLDPGTYTLRVWIPQDGLRLCSNARKVTPGSPVPKLDPEFAAEARASFLLLPPKAWGGAPYHGIESIDLVPLGGRRYELYTLVDAESPKSSALPLEAFIVDPQHRLVHSTPLDVEGHEARLIDQQGREFRQNRAVYVLPGALPPGEYRILVRAENAESHFTLNPHRCSAPPGAASRWIPFRVE